MRVLPVVLLLLSCGSDRSMDGAETLVERYTATVIEAYRRADPVLVEPVAGPELATRIAGLIGVKSDMGMTLDARLLDLEFAGIRRVSPDCVEAVTREIWSYQDLRIGDGQVVGDPSRDRYHMLYTMRREAAGWKVESTRFLLPAEVGRQRVTLEAPVQILHGLPPGEDVK